MFTMIMSIEFWIGFMIKFLISELLNSKPMNNLVKIIIAGVGTIMWGLKATMTHKIVFGISIHQDYSKEVRIPLPTP